MHKTLNVILSPRFVFLLLSLNLAESFLSHTHSPYLSIPARVFAPLLIFQSTRASLLSFHYLQYSGRNIIASVLLLAPLFAHVLGKLGLLHLIIQRYPSIGSWAQIQSPEISRAHLLTHSLTMQPLPIQGISHSGNMCTSMAYR